MPKVEPARAHALRVLLALALMLAPLPLAFVPHASGLAVPICGPGGDPSPQDDLTAAQHCPACILVAPAPSPGPDTAPLPGAVRVSWPGHAATVPAPAAGPHPQARAPPG